MPNSPSSAFSTATKTAPIRVAFCGPIGQPGQPAGGGYEAANRRTCDALRRRGVCVLEWPYPKVCSGRWRKLWRYGAHFLRTAVCLLVKRQQYDVFHLTPLNMHFALAETVLVSCAKWAGRPVLFDVRAGTFMRHYNGGSAFYRGTVKRTLRLATRVGVEGQEYVEFVKQHTTQPVFYFPNYVDSPSLQRQLPVRHLLAGDEIRFIYFGRLVPEKGVETALQTLALLMKRGHAVALELIGEGSPAYLAAMKQCYAHLPVTWTDSLPVENILQRARHAHFFFFASRHEGEGHSNSLNEAMSVGLVPVCSTQGFTQSVVGDAGVVLPVDSSPETYAQAVEELVQLGQWAELSQRARHRLQTLYSEDAVVPMLMQTYQDLLLKR
jgi:glycosyltransferase involved in cell wall biosynthesis